MKKHLTVLLSMILILSVVTVCPVSAAGVNIQIDGRAVQFTTDSGSPFVDKSNRTQVPLRVTMEHFGCEVSWDTETKTATVSKDGTEVDVPIGLQCIYVSGIRTPIDTAAQIVNGRTYLPIRAVLEAFGAEVGWEQATQTVTVKSPQFAPITKADVLTIYILDVGQGDAVLIDAGDYEVLIDAGDNSYGNTVVNEIRPYVGGSLDLVIATHPDADHIGGLDTVLAAYDVDRVIDSGCAATTATYKDYWAAALAEPGCSVEFDDDMVIAIPGYEDTALKIIETGDAWDSNNGNSVVCELVYNKVKVLFTGDMDEIVERDNLNQFDDINVLKVGHHGSATSTCDRFLSKIKPEYAVISAGSGNRYGHPTAATLNRLSAIGTKVLGTFKSGTIKMTTDGTTYSFDSTIYLMAADAGATGSQTSQTLNNTTTTVEQETKPTTTPSVTPTPQPTQETTVTYIGNKNTKKFHYASCSSVSRMSASNKVSLSSRATAISAGYVPCGICQP